MNADVIINSSTQRKNVKLTAKLSAVFLALFASFSFGQQRTVAFTFDDGPNLAFLAKALPYLESEKIPATFFVIGSVAKSHSEILAIESKQGNEIENHTYGHVCLVKPGPKWTGCMDISLARALSEITRTNQIIKKATGLSPHFVRPPYFAMTAERRRDIRKFTGMEVIEHGSDSIGSLDWVYSSPEKITAQVETEARKRGMKSYVVVFHERLITLEALPRIISFFRGAGYRFVRLDEYESAKNGKGKR